MRAPADSDRSRPPVPIDRDQAVSALMKGDLETFSRLNQELGFWSRAAEGIAVYDTCRVGACCSGGSSVTTKKTGQLREPEVPGCISLLPGVLKPPLPS